jgi:hypothetical protein
MNDTKWKKKNVGPEIKYVEPEIKYVEPGIKYVEPEIKRFSQDESNFPIIEGFQEEPDIIIQKIKKISRNKERKKSNPNYKNIPKLDNIYEKDDDGFEEIEKTMNEITNILNGDIPEEANNLSEPSVEKNKKEPFKEGAKCKRNTAIAGIVDKINKGVAYVDNFLFKNFDKYLTIGIGAVYDTIEGNNNSLRGEISNLFNSINKRVGGFEKKMDAARGTTRGTPAATRATFAATAHACRGACARRAQRLRVRLLGQVSL